MHVSGTNKASVCGTRNGNCANKRENRVSNSPLQLAMREMHREFQRPVLWVALAGVGVVLAMAGAFGTAEVLRPVPLVLYWVAVVVLTYGAGALTVGILRRMLTRAPHALRLVLTGLGAGLIVSVVVGGINMALFGVGWAEGAAALQFAASTIGVAFVVTIVLEFAFAQAQGSETADPPALLTRLPLEKRGRLVSLSAVDHYVEVTTTKGTELVLMRLADAISETHPTQGLQIHRSHWVAHDHVRAVKRGSGKATITLSDGRTLPVSRSNLPSLKEYGLLPD